MGEWGKDRSAPAPFRISHYNTGAGLCVPAGVAPTCKMRWLGAWSPGVVLHRQNRRGPYLAKQEDVVRVQGTVVETLPNAMFRVQVDGGLEVLARASGKMRRGRYIRILPGDRVDLDLSVYDPSRGRIVWRYKD